MKDIRDRVLTAPCLLLALLLPACAHGPAARLPTAKPVGDALLTNTPLCVEIRNPVSGVGPRADAAAVMSIRLDLLDHGEAKATAARFAVTRIFTPVNQGGQSGQRGYAGLLSFRCRVTDSLKRELHVRELLLGFGHRAIEEAPVEVWPELPVAIEHTLEVALLDKPGGKPLHQARIDFLIRPRARARGWDDYVAFAWEQGRGSGSRSAVKQSRGLAELPINGRMVYQLDAAGANAMSARRIKETGDFNFYVEDVLRDVLAPYRDRPRELLRPIVDEYAKNPNDVSVWTRRPQFADPDINRRIDEACEQHVRLHKIARPRFYSLALEPSTGVGSAASEFCRGAETRTAFRAWLRRQYGTLGGINKQWGASFTAWEQVEADTARQALARAERNISSWNDHRAFMDRQLAGACRRARDSFRRSDPQSRIGMVGPQRRPGLAGLVGLVGLPPPAAHGGYDYSLLAQAVDVIGVTGPDANTLLLRGLRPAVIPLGTLYLSAQDQAAAVDPLRLGELQYSLWRGVLDGQRGVIFLGDGAALVDENETGRPTPTALARALAPTLKELTGGIATLLAHAKPRTTGIAIHYSPASIRAQWMRQHRANPKRWERHARDTLAARTEDASLRLRESWVKLLEDIGQQPTFISTDAIVRGHLLPRGRYQDIRVVVLPRSLAIGDAEARALRMFVRRGGVLIQDGFAGTLDGHGKPREQGVLDDLFEEGRDCTTLDVDLTEYIRWRLTPTPPPTRTDVKASKEKFSELRTRVDQILRKAGCRPGEFHPNAIAFTLRAGQPRTMTYDLPGLKIIALQRNWQTDRRELCGQIKLDASALKALRVAYPDLQGRWVADLRRVRETGVRREWPRDILLEPWAPVILAVFDREPDASTLRATSKVVTSGRVVRFEDYTPQRRARVCRYVLRRPDGTTTPGGQGQIYSADGRIRGEIPTARSDPPGAWTLEVHDITTGQVNRLTVQVRSH